jgi:hypothetical protein
MKMLTDPAMLSDGWDGMNGNMGYRLTGNIGDTLVV